MILIKIACQPGKQGKSLSAVIMCCERTCMIAVTRRLSSMWMAIVGIVLEMQGILIRKIVFGFWDVLPQRWSMGKELCILFQWSMRYRIFQEYVGAHCYHITENEY